MTSAKKRSSNRDNARKSTGPKTAEGRARSAQNARKHGLNVPVLSDLLWSEGVGAAVSELLEGAVDGEIRLLARQFAISQIDLCRIRSARDRLLFNAMDNPEWNTESSWREKDKAVLLFLRDLGAFTPMPKTVGDFLESFPQGEEKFALVLKDKIHELLLLNRYERRALSRRKFALRALDRAIANNDTES